PHYLIYLLHPTTTSTLLPYTTLFRSVTDVEQETFPPGLNEEIIARLSAKKEEPEWMLEWRLKAYRHWLNQTEPTWANVRYTPIEDRKSTRLNSSHVAISYAVFCLKKK